MSQKNNPYVTNNPTEFHDGYPPDQIENSKLQTVITVDATGNPFVGENNQVELFDDKQFGKDVHITGYSCLPNKK